MNENEKEIARINGEARKRGLSYGQYVARARLLPEDGDLSTALRSQQKRTPTAKRRDPSRGISPKGEAKDAAGQGAAKKWKK